MENFKKTHLTKIVKQLREDYGIAPLAEEINTGIYFENKEVEEIVIGKLMLEPDSLWEVSDILTEEMFSEVRTRKTYAAITALAKENRPYDIISVIHYLRLHEINSFGSDTFDASYVAGLTTRIASSRNLMHDAMIIVQLFAAKHGVAMAQTAIEIFKTGDAAEGFEYMEQKMFDIQNIYNQNYEITNTAILGNDVIDSYLKTLQLKQKGIQPGVSFGYDAMDNAFGRIQSDDLVIIAARPSMGKTSLALCMMLNLAEQGFASAFFSIESSKNQITTKIGSVKLKVPYSDISEAKIDDEEKYNQFLEGSWAEVPIYIDDSAPLTPARMEAKIRRFIMLYNIKIVFIDYIQKMHSDVAAFSRNDEIGLITGALKRINKKYAIPVVALAQLNRGNEARSDTRPKLSDLRSSGEIEQDADKVIFIHREAYYDIDMKTNQRIQDVELICEKNRNGATGNVFMKFDSLITTFLQENQVGELPF